MTNMAAMAINSKWTNGLNLYDLKQKLPPEVALGLYTCLLPF